MAISKPKKYTRILDNEIFYAVKVTARNFISAAHWVAGEEFELGTAETAERYDKKLGAWVEQRVRVRTPKGWRRADIGDYIVRGGEKTFVVVKADDFEGQFELVKPKKTKK